MQKNSDLLFQFACRRPAHISSVIGEGAISPAKAERPQQQPNRLEFGGRGSSSPIVNVDA